MSQPMAQHWPTVYLGDSVIHDDSDSNAKEEISNMSKNRELIRLLCTPAITILVGPSQQRFHIHSGLLCRHSLFFKRMIHGGCFRETKENIIRLPEDDVTSFSVFAQYLYAGSQCDTRCSLDIKNMNMDSENWLSVIQPDIFHSTFGNPCILSSEEDWIDDELSDLEVKDNAAHDAYNFMLQFSCYVLADKIQASGFKQLIMNEIWCHGDICNSADLTVKHVRYAYQNTISRYDPLRQFCIMIRGGRIPIEETLADDEFVALMEDGGALVKDMMQECRHQALKQKQKIESHEREIADWKREIQDYREQNQICIDENQTYERDIQALKEQLQRLEHSRSPMFCTTTDSSPMFQNYGAFRY